MHWTLFFFKVIPQYHIERNKKMSSFATLFAYRIVAAAFGKRGVQRIFAVDAASISPTEACLPPQGLQENLPFQIDEVFGAENLGK